MSSIDNYLKEWTKLVGRQKKKDSTEKLIDNLSNDILANDSSNNLSSYNSIAFPIVKKVLSATLAGGGWKKSKKQQLKENRINKLRKINGKKPNIVLPYDEYIDGLVSVQPLSAPLGTLFYMDYFYDTIKTKRKKKLNNINKIFRKEKLKYIQEILSKK